MGLAVGLEDGRLVLYDLTELQIFEIVFPKSEVAMSPIVKMDFLEPPDDPRPCLYIWTLHENDENLHAVLHSLMYEKRFIEEYGCRVYFEVTIKMLHMYLLSIYHVYSKRYVFIIFSIDISI